MGAYAVCSEWTRTWRKKERKEREERKEKNEGMKKGKKGRKGVGESESHTIQCNEVMKE